MGNCQRRAIQTPVNAHRAPRQDAGDDSNDEFDDTTWTFIPNDCPHARSPLPLTFVRSPMPLPPSSSTAPNATTSEPIMVCMFRRAVLRIVKLLRWRHQYGVRRGMINAFDLGSYTRTALSHNTASAMRGKIKNTSKLFTHLVRIKGVLKYKHQVMIPDPRRRL